MEVDNRVLLTNEQQIQLRKWEELFKQAAWEWVVKDATTQREQLENYLVHSAMTEGDMREARGMIKALEHIIGLEQGTEAHFSQMVDDAELTREEIRESQGANA